VAGLTPRTQAPGWPVTWLARWPRWPGEPVGPV